MRILIVLMLAVLAPSVAGSYLVVTMDVTDSGVYVQDFELAFNAVMRSSHDDTDVVSVEVIDERWRSVSRARITASVVEVIDGASVRYEASERVRMTAIVPVDERARMLVVRGAGGGQIFDLHGASCGIKPLCSNCARVYPDWCARARSSDSRFDPSLVLAVVLNALILASIVVFLMARRRA